MDSMRKLEEIFSRFPGIGPRQARRFAYHLLAKSPQAIAEFVDSVKEVRRSAQECTLCHRYFMRGGASSGSCPICEDKSRDHSSLMIVARDSDMETIEKSGAYKGLYFVLGGTIPILDKDPERRIRLERLLERVSSDSSLKEAVLSLNTTPDGEHTERIVREGLERVLTTQVRSGLVKITVLGRGLSTGAELEYADSDTIRNALKNRR